MKVLALVKDGVYICEVQHSELEKYMKLYYNKMKPLQVGEEVDLSRGYDFYSAILTEYDRYKELVTSSKASIERGLLAFIKRHTKKGGRK